MKKPFKPSEYRSVARMRRSTKATILEMHANTLRHRAFLAEYAEWETTPEYQKELQRIRDLIAEIEADGFEMV